MDELLYGEVIEKLRKAAETGVLPQTIVDKTVLQEAIDAIEALNQDVDEWLHIFAMYNKRENRSKYIDWWRKQNGESDLTYPDADEVYRDFWEVMSDLRSVCEGPNMFQLVMLHDKWGFGDG